MRPADGIPFRSTIPSLIVLHAKRRVIFPSVFEDSQRLTSTEIFIHMEKMIKEREKEDLAAFLLFCVYSFPQTDTAFVLCGTRLPNNFPVTVASKLRGSQAPRDFKVSNKILQETLTGRCLSCVAEGRVAKYHNGIFVPLLCDPVAKEKAEVSKCRLVRNWHIKGLFVRRGMDEDSAIPLFGV